jgi:protein-S-isoprenylcysteine O-methyltransferase Ste14
MRDLDTSDNAGVRIFPPGIFLAGLVLGYLLQWFWPLPIVPGASPSLMTAMGVIVLILGVLLIGTAVLSFRAVGEDPNPTRTTRRLTFDGPYRFTRNPMYVGMALLLAGFALIGNALWPLVALVPVLIVVRTQVIAKEEAYLERKFGAEYAAYTARIRRWI